MILLILHPFPREIGKSYHPRAKLCCPRAAYCCPRASSYALQPSGSNMQPLGNIIFSPRAVTFPVSLGQGCRIVTFSSISGQNLVLHISKVLKTPFWYKVMWWLGVQPLGQQSEYQFQKFKLFEMWSTRSDPKLPRNAKDFHFEVRLVGCSFSRKLATYSIGRTSRERAPL